MTSNFNYQRVAAIAPWFSSERTPTRYSRKKRRTKARHQNTTFHDKIVVVIIDQSNAVERRQDTDILRSRRNEPNWRSPFHCWQCLLSQ